MKRTPLRRKTLLKPGKPLQRRTPLRPGGRLKRTPLKPVNPERRKRLESEQYGEYADEWIRGHPCMICGAPSVAAHAAKTRGAGGNKRHLVKLCPDHEDEFHDMGKLSFEREYDVDLELAAWKLWQEWKECG